MSQTTHSRGSAWRVPAMLILLGLVPAIGGAARLGELVGGAEVTPANERFFAMPIPILLHIFSVVPFSLLGALQFAPGLRRGKSSWHRTAGRALGPLGIVVALSGLWMTIFYPWANNDGELVFLFRLVFGTAMLMSIVLGLDAVRRRDFATHGAWMIRGYAIGMGAGTQVLTHLPWFVFVDGTPPELPRAVMMGAGWVINAALAEWVIRTRLQGGKRRAATGRAQLLPSGAMGSGV